MPAFFKKGDTLIKIVIRGLMSLIVGFSSVVASHAAMDVVYLPAGLLTCSTKDIKSGEEWQAVYCGGKGAPVCALKPVRLLNSANQITIDPASINAFSAELASLFLSTVHDAKTRVPLFLVKGLSNPVYGLVPTFYQPAYGEPNPALEGSSNDINIITGAGREYKIKSKFVRGTRNRIDYLLAHDEKIMPLGETYLQGNDELPTGSQLLRWAGDIDRDGNPDFLINTPRQVSRELDYRLFLSSEAKEENPVGAVGRMPHWLSSSETCNLR